MNDFFGEPGRLVKFLSLVFGLLMAASTVACLLYEELWQAIAAAVLGAWALVLFTEVVKAELIEAVGRRKAAEPSEAGEPDPDLPQQRSSGVGQGKP